ncbi:Uncharacterised protein [Yersinia enterocolitica]|uniref:hypothetical protein n=1 Tax=Yersinia enterocolitica TaxID=630 RepID=UPI0005E15847|nr:hypothetical protein [Yersinia enterocolitica]CQJ45079.1 Uncharacterised protein [Yersinia enterocolitica]
MADENTGLVVIDIKPESYPTLYVTNGLDKYLNQIRQAVNEVPDVTTAKGRARIASLAASASRSKTAIEKPGREYLRHLKEQPKIIEAELRRFVIECDEIRDETRRPLTEWEAEQERLKQEAERVQREAKQKEDARLAEEKRVADEAAARAANEAHRKTVGTAVVNGLIEHAGLTREQAIATLCAIKDSKIPHTNIHY